MRGIEEARGVRFGAKDFYQIVRQWYDMSQFQRHPFGDYLAEFTAAYGDVHTPLGAPGILDATWAASETAPPVSEVPVEYGEELARLAKWCRELQRQRGDRPFFLSMEDVRRRVTPEMKGKRKASDLLKTLVQFRVLGLVSRGVRPHASSYRYVGDKGTND